MAQGFDLANMERIKSQIWSNETLVRGMTKVASQPFNLHAIGMADDPELVAEYAVALAVPTSFFGGV